MGLLSFSLVSPTEAALAFLPQKGNELTKAAKSNSVLLLFLSCASSDEVVARRQSLLMDNALQ
jgi:hypothetical protein